MQKLKIRNVRLNKTKYALLAHKDVLLVLEKLEKDVKQNKQDIALVFLALKQLINPPQPVRRMIGFKSNS